MGVSLLKKKTGFVLLPDSQRQATSQYSTTVDKNGLVQVVPRKKSRRSFGAPIRLILLFGVLITIFKALAVLNVGLTAYEEQLTALSSGNIVEQVGSVLLSVDPLTNAVIQGIAPLIR
ncbi:hypothetical protein [Planktotalea sp.]|uniref:hypothetical protein n=1 Tax=Planktotalea sp. TaxID=2029877 RepID=UPI0035C8448A